MKLNIFQKIILEFLKIIDFIVSDIIKTYGIYFFFINKVFIKTCIINKKIFITGFPRSGNTFASRLIKVSYPDLKYVSHFHNIASLKLAIKNHLPIICLKRNKLDSITSLLLKRNIRDKNLLFWFKFYEYRYQKYYAFAKQHKILIYDFNNLIKNPDQFIKIVSKKIKRPYPKYFNLIIKNIYDSFYYDKRDLREVTYPNKEKENLKKNILNLILN